MQTWKTKKRVTSSVIHKPWKAKAMTIVFLVSTVGIFVLDFPQLWNQSSTFVKSKTGWSTPMFVDKNGNPVENIFRLGLDLQGGTHLVYEADMKDIPEKDRGNALSGVRDVIERRVNAFGVSEPIVQTSDTGGSSRVIVELAGVLDVKDAIKQIGETPVLEFKEEGEQLDKQPTAEDKKELSKRQIEDRAAAATVLKKAMSGEDFETLVKDNSLEKTKSQTKGIISKITSDSTQYSEIGKAISQNNLKSGQVYWKTIESGNTIEIVKVRSVSTAKNMNLSHILLCYDGKQGCSSKISSLDAMSKLQSIKNEVNTSNFGELAKKNSTDPSAATNNGDLGWGTSEKYVPEFSTAAELLGVGDISDPIETNFGYHLIYKKGEKMIPSYEVQHITMKLSQMTDVLPPNSPWKNTALSGKNLTRADVQFDQKSGSPFVGITFNSEGSDLFGKLTEANVGKKIAIFLDGSPISEPTVQTAIYGGQAIITGDFTLDEAKLLSQRLNAGALPVPVSLLSQQTVGPTLGIASLQKSILAAIWGFIFVAIYMLLLYRLPGFIAVVALFLFAFLNLLCYRIFGVTVTLAGIAGFVLSLGIAVDANVLTIERLREEYANGRDLLPSVDEARRRAWSAIRDGHLTTLISAMVLYWFSSSFIKGFALTLGIGVVLSLFTAVYVSHVYLRTILNWKWTHHPVLFGTNKKQQ